MNYWTKLGVACTALVVVLVLSVEELSYFGHTTAALLVYTAQIVAATVAVLCMIASTRDPDELDDQDAVAYVWVLDLDNDAEEDDWL